jgi:hypothetical protein
MNQYNFGKVTCASGAIKEFSCRADSFQQARALLMQFVKNN